MAFDNGQFTKDYCPQLAKSRQTYGIAQGLPAMFFRLKSLAVAFKSQSDCRRRPCSKASRIAADARFHRLAGFLPAYPPGTFAAAVLHPHPRWPVRNTSIYSGSYLIPDASLGSPIPRSFSAAGTFPGAA